MAGKKEQTQERKIYVTIRSPSVRKEETYESWRYWEIVGELIFRSADRIEAYDAARWCGRFARHGNRKELAPDITMEVYEMKPSVENKSCRNCLYFFDDDERWSCFNKKHGPYCCPDEKCDYWELEDQGNDKG